jgi:hypothetical protein
MKEVDQIVYLGSMVEKSGKTLNKINERIGKALEIYYLGKS